MGGLGEGDVLPEGEIRVHGAGQTVRISIDARVIDTAGLPEMTFIGFNGMVAIEAEHSAIGLVYRALPGRQSKITGVTLSL
jgi:ribosomal protein L21E